MAKSEAQQLGYDFEDEVKDVFKNLQTKTPFFWHRFPDAKAARGHLAAQPSDFLVTRHSSTNDVLLLETKASLEKPSLTKCVSMISSTQRGMHKKWHRAGQESVFVFYSQIENKIEIWDGRYLINCLADSVKPTKEGLIAEADYFELETTLVSFLTGKL